MARILLSFINMIGIVLCLIVSIIVLLSHSSDASFILFHHNYNQKQQKCRVSFFSSNLQLNAIKSPFDEERGTGTTITAEDNSSSYTRTDPVEMQEEILDLTLENVELVLDEMRPYLIQDGGNVKVQDIDGPVVRLQLEGACGTCPSSTQTMKMGLERRLRERIPEIQQVIQAMPEGPELNEDQVDVILNGVRPFLKVAGGNIQCVQIHGVGGIQPVITLQMTGSSSTLNSVKLEIVQRLQRHFMISGLRVDWA